MKNYHYSAISVAVMMACYSGQILADLRTQCLAGVPHFQGEIIAGESKELPIYISADNAEINHPYDASYQGNVEVIQGSRKVKADAIKIVKQEDKNSLMINGNFDYQDSLLSLVGKDSEINLSNKDADLNHVTYQFVDRQGRGTAEAIHLRQNSRTLKNGVFTSCLPNSNDWKIEAKEMTQHIDEEYAEMWHARFKVLDVPVFYMPYWQMPIGDRRRSGFLIPEVQHSNLNGFTYAQPIYLNIAPNMDATLTPIYYSHRGWQMNSELRYLNQLGQGLVATEYLNKERLDKWKNADHRSRYLLYWNHKSKLLNNWRVSLDYTKVSDKYYFSDFDSYYGQTTDGYISQSFNLSYFQAHYNFSISGKKFQIFDHMDIKPYRMLPQVSFNYYKYNLAKNGYFKLNLQATYFDNDSSTMPTAWRFHIEPTLNFPVVSHYGRLNLETKLYATHYWQKRGENSDAESVTSHVTRVLPQVKLDFKTVLESEYSVIDGFSQILEPKVQYLFRPYRNQSNIGSKRRYNLGLGYDSTLLQQDYYSLFSDRSYSGLDRIASANQITLGSTIRFFKQKTGEEHFNFSFGQIYYLTSSRIDNEHENNITGRSSSWVLESNWKLNNKWNWHGSYQYDTRSDKTALANFVLQYKPKEFNLLQLNYRYVSQDYIDQNLSTNSNSYGQNIRQIGGVVGWELTDNIVMTASHYRDIAFKKPIETRFALNYNTCCWNTTVYVARYIVPAPNGSVERSKTAYYDNRVGVNFSLNFGTNYTNNMSKMLNKGLIPYNMPF